MVAGLGAGAYFKVSRHTDLAGDVGGGAHIGIHRHVARGAGDWRMMFTLATWIRRLH
jgi:hypothetical protein